MGMKKQTSILDLKDEHGKASGKLIVRAERVGNSRNSVYMQWAGLKLMNTDGWFGKSDPLLRIFKSRENEWVKVHETEWIMDNLNPVWKPFEINDDKLCGGDDTRPIRIECWDWEKSGVYQYIGDCQLTLSDLKSGKKEWELSNPKKKKKTGTLKIVQFAIKEKYSFIDYIRGGEHLSVIVAIDFTGSNGSPNQPSSLHYRFGNGMNQYQAAIHAVCQILLNYDYDQMVPVFGFGGKPLFPGFSSKLVSHCFPCTGDPNNAEVYGLDGIMQAYNHALNNVELSGPTYFAPIFTETMALAQAHKKEETNTYTILLVLTDGEIHDMDKTIDLLVNAAGLPLSIIIVGVGNEEFENMRTLDGDNGLFNSKGQKAPRDLVQFVPFRDFAKNPAGLAREVLAEIPDQLVEYMTYMKKKPRPPEIVDVKKLEVSTSDNFQGQQFVQNLGTYFQNHGLLQENNIQNQQQGNFGVQQQNQ